MSERLYKRSEIRQLLGITKYRYEQLIEQGILGKPIRLAENSHPLHTESQLLIAESKLREQSAPPPSSTGKRAAMSDKMFKLIQQSASR